MDKELHKELERLVEVRVGKMTIPELYQDLIKCITKSPELVVITMERVSDEFGKSHYHSALYIKEKH